MTTVHDSTASAGTASTLAAEIKRAQAAGDPDDGSTYYRHWLSAIEHLVVDKGVVTLPTSTRVGLPGTVPHTRPHMAGHPAGERPDAALVSRVSSQAFGLRSR